MAGGGVGDVLRGTPGAPGLDRVGWVQPVLWAVMVSLAGLWGAWGLRRCGGGAFPGRDRGAVWRGFVVAGGGAGGGGV